MALSDAFAPVLSSLYQHLDQKAARNILHCFCRLICAAWDWAQTTEDAKGEPKVVYAVGKLADVIDDPHEPPSVGRHLIWSKSGS